MRTGRSADPPRLAQGGRRRARPRRVLLRLREDGQAARPRRDHRHRQRRLRGDDPRPQPRLPQLHRLLRHPPVAAGRGPSRSSRTTSSTGRGRRQEAQAVRRRQGDARRPRRRDGRHRPAALAARADRHRGAEGGQARLLREADGALGPASARRCAASPARRTSSWRSATSGTTRCSTTTPTTSSRTTTSARSATSAPSGTATTPSPRSPRTRTASRSTTPRPASPIYVSDEEGNIVYIDGWKPDDPRAGQERRLRQVRLQEPRRAGPLAALQPHRRGPDGRAGQPPARRLLDLPGQEAPAGRHRASAAPSSTPTAARSTTTSSSPSSSPARTTAGGKDKGRPRRRHLLVDQHQRVRELRRDA